MSVRQTQGVLDLQSHEVAVVHAASRIFAALIRNGRLTNSNHSTLIRSAEALERMEKVDTLVVDKTGTLTEGRPRVVGVVPAGGFRRERSVSIQ